MSLTLYRKYRPQSFEEVIGQNHIKITLQNEIETNKVAHAYLFSGPRGLGKTTMARLLAKSINCKERQEKTSEPCNKCDSCKELMEGRSLDIIEIDAASHTGVDNVRENIINSSRFTPTKNKFKVFIIDEIHMLSISAFNALLKTLEEPPAHAMFILATTEIHKVPQTIISRCQRFDFRKVSAKDLIQRLNFIISQEKKKVDKVVLENVARAAEGCVRDAESLLGQILSLDEKEITLEQAELVIPASRFDLVLELINYLIKKDSAQALALVNHLVQEGIDLPKFTIDLIEILRKILLIKIGPQLSEFTHTLTQKLEKEISEISLEIDLKNLIFIMNTFIDAKQELKSSEIVQLPLEVAVVKICSQINTDNKEDSNSGSSLTFNNPTPKTKKQEVLSPASKEEAKKPKPVNKIKLTLEQIKEKWDEVLAGIRNQNQSLASTLRLHQPSAIKEDGTLEICFKYKFHQQRIVEVKNRRILEETLQKIFNTPIRIQTIIVENPAANNSEIQPQQSQKDETVNNLLETFGGQIIK